MDDQGMQNKKQKEHISLWTTHAFSDVAVVPFPWK